MAKEVLILPPEYRNRFEFVRVTGPRHTLAVEPMRVWLNDESRPGLYLFGQQWLANEGNYSPQDCIDLAITDPDVAMEFKLRWG